MSQEPDEYLKAVLRDQTLADGSDELEALRKRGSEVKSLLRGHFYDYSPSIQNTGSYKKGTMVRASFDLDILCFFPSDTKVANNLREIYEAVGEPLADEYFISKKRSAIKLLDPTEDDDPNYFHVDVVPGRFVNGSDGDVFLHQEVGDKDRLKTNPEKQINHVEDSGVRSAIKLMKVWREKRGFTVPTFVLELLVIDLLEDREDESLPNQLVHVWTEFGERVEDLSVTDPANSNNDLTDVFDAATKTTVSHAASMTLDRIEALGWESVFGEVDEDKKAKKAAKVASATGAVDDPHRPWCSV